MWIALTREAHDLGKRRGQGFGGALLKKGGLWISTGDTWFRWWFDRRRVLCRLLAAIKYGMIGLWTDEWEGNGYMMYFFFQVEEEWTDKREGSGYMIPNHQRSGSPIRICNYPLATRDFTTCNQYDSDDDDEDEVDYRDAIKKAHDGSTHWKTPFQLRATIDKTHAVWVHHTFPNSLRP
ncbi:hypothetical protein L6452_35589 [Arctium lappa]|uniref:Uncharacterized protein n=1 Tax=Arctium lappa TaxID=4217 RepID=A0ACB8YB17_ARCLA|nr:hypothetical protein L6452_35589 [Arctium lappa]